jgi:uncharacterized OB-fold protein
VQAVIPPGIDRSNDWFWDGVRQGRLLIQRCASCGTLRYPNAPMCGVCQSLEWDTQEATGRGTVLTWIVAHHPTREDEIRVVVLVDLEEGVRMVSNIVDFDPAEVEQGLPLELTFRTYGDVVLPQFTVVREVAAR